MSSLVNYVCSVGTDLKDSITNLAVDLTGTRPHNIIDPCSTDSVLRKPAIPLCTSIPGGQLEEGTLIAIVGTPSSSFSRSFRIDFLVEKCEHANRTPCCHKKTAHTHNHRHVHHSAEDHDAATTVEQIQSPAGDQVPPPPPGMTTLENRQIAFHFNPRFATLSENDVVVMNSLLGGEWGYEIRLDSFPFKIGTTFKMMILVEKECFKIAVDGRHCFEFKHQWDFRDIGRIHIEGNINVDLVEFRKELQYLGPPGSSSSSSISSGSTTASTSPESELGVPPPIPSTSTVRSRTVASPTLPYSEMDPRLGTVYNVYIAGLMPNNFKRPFVLNLIASKAATRTIPFHMSIRPDSALIVRNSMSNGEWSSQSEELYLEGPFPFVLGTHFDLMLCHKTDIISVAVNGQLAFEFKHRMDCSTIDTIEITGSQLITSIRYEFF